MTTTQFASSAEPVEVTDEMMDEQIQTIRKRYATQVPVERPVQWGDILIADVAATADDEPFIEDSDAEFQLVEGETLFVARPRRGFPRHVEG